jgi:hypothetical protein
LLLAPLEELFLSVQLELVQCFRPRLPPKAVELLTVHTNDVAQISVPPEDNAEHVVEFGERHAIADRDQADDHRAHLAHNRPQNQALEGGCFNHLYRTTRSLDPRLFGALRYGLPHSNHTARSGLSSLKAIGPSVPSEGSRDRLPVSPSPFTGLNQCLSLSSFVFSKDSIVILLGLQREPLDGVREERHR